MGASLGPANNVVGVMVRSAQVVVGQRGERGFGLPRHVGVGVAAVDLVASNLASCPAGRCRRWIVGRTRRGVTPWLPPVRALATDGPVPVLDAGLGLALAVVVAGVA